MQRIYGTVTDGLRAVPYAQVSVYTAGSTTLATIYNAYEGLTPTTAVANPITADALGNWVFAAPSGNYTISWNPGSGAARTIPYLNVP